MTSDSWWATALSERVGGGKPLAVVCNGEEIVLFRNGEGALFALEDRCPHRRVPLSLGCVVGSGLQCGYHGWTFDGASGACIDIPNLHGNERVPPRYAARAYPVSEIGGFVHVWLGADEPDSAQPTLDYLPSGREFSGAAIASIDHEQYLAVMLDGPECLLEFAGVRMTDFFLGDPRLQDGYLVLERGAVWDTQVLPSNFVVDYPLIVRTAVPLKGGSIRVELLSEEETPIASLLIASAANRRGTTSLCWRGFLHDAPIAKAPLRWRFGRMLKHAPFKIHAQVDGAAIAALLVAPSRDLADLRRQTLIPVRVAG
jgi:nitrite reductase/ring-hydroxylating ferredoxin subunit